MFYKIQLLIVLVIFNSTSASSMESTETAIEKFLEHEVDLHRLKRNIVFDEIRENFPAELIKKQKENLSKIKEITKTFDLFFQNRGTQVDQEDRYEALVRIGGALMHERDDAYYFIQSIHEKVFIYPKNKSDYIV
jgi:hypothetical protein